VFPRFLNLFTLVLTMTLAAGASSLWARGLQSSLQVESSILNTERASASSPLMQLALLSEMSPSRKRTIPPLSESDADLRVPTQLRLLVFSPHPDDETLATGGLIQRVLKQGGTVRIVFMTNGDGFLDGVRAEFDIAEPTDHNYIEYGKMRQQEALKAVSQLGLEEGDAIFLGFPDGGLDDLWAEHWSTLSPYTSPSTRWNYPAYSSCTTRSIKYSGKDLLDEMMRVMSSFSPDWVAFPDTRDTHPDHAATGAFVLDALRRLRESGEPPFTETQAFTYLVHYPLYPDSQGWMGLINKPQNAGFLPNSPSLSTTRWLTLTIDSHELEGKRQALACHETQIEPLQYLLIAFLKRYETFGHLRPNQIMEVPLDYAARFRRPKS
jgi:LmbE family N-acetylglucosaminyl deacetylase